MPPPDDKSRSSSVDNVSDASGFSSTTKSLFATFEASREWPWRDEDFVEYDDEELAEQERRRAQDLAVQERRRAQNDAYFGQLGETGVEDYKIDALLKAAYAPVDLMQNGHVRSIGPQQLAPAEELEMEETEASLTPFSASAPVFEDAFSSIRRAEAVNRMLLSKQQEQEQQQQQFREQLKQQHQQQQQQQQLNEQHKQRFKRAANVVYKQREKIQRQEQQNARLMEEQAKLYLNREILPIVMQTLESAQEEIIIVMFEFRLVQIWNKLVEKARKNGVQVKVIVDYKQWQEFIRNDPFSKEVMRCKERLVNDLGAVVRTYKPPREKSSMHMKFLLVDRKTDRRRALEGSCNLTYAGTKRSDEHMTLHKEKAYIHKFYQVYEKLWHDGAPQPA